MRRIIPIVLSILLIISSCALSSCSSSGIGEYEGEVNVYNWGEYISPGDEGV